MMRLRDGLIAAALSLAGCHVSRVQPRQPTCYDNAVVSCESCTNRGCAWCSQGPNASDGYCCEASSRCSNPIRTVSACAPIDDCEHASIHTCSACKHRNCAWCPGETRCHARGQDGTFPSCAGRVEGADDCPATATPGGDP